MKRILFALFAVAALLFSLPAEAQGVALVPVASKAVSCETADLTDAVNNALYSNPSAEIKKAIAGLLVYGLCNWFAEQGDILVLIRAPADGSYSALMRNPRTGKTGWVFVMDLDTSSMRKSGDRSAGGGKPLI